MFWGISQEHWLELWSGAVGAALSAVLAALVAVFVVKATNKHQGDLAATALAAQREDAAAAIASQQAIFERQLREEREETRRAEKTRALAEFVSGVRELSAIHSKTDALEVNAIVRQLEASAASLDILGDDDEGLHALLHPSIRVLYTLSLHSVIDFQIKERSGAREVLADCARAICSLAPKWWSSEEGHGRRFIRGEIRLTLEKAEAFNKSMKAS